MASADGQEHETATASAIAYLDGEETAPPSPPVPGGHDRDVADKHVYEEGNAMTVPAPPPQSITVLVVEDDDTTQLVAHKMLERFNCNVKAVFLR